MCRPSSERASATRPVALRELLPLELLDEHVQRALETLRDIARGQHLPEQRLA